MEFSKQEYWSGLPFPSPGDLPGSYQHLLHLLHWQTECTNCATWELVETDGNHVYMPCVLCLVARSCSALCDPMDCSLPGSSVHGDSPGKTTRVGCHAFLQGIFSTQGLIPGLPHCRWILYQLSHKESPRKLEWVAYPFSSGDEMIR